MKATTTTADPNPFFPLAPGNKWLHENEEETITIPVEDDAIEILGVTFITVRDVVMLTYRLRTRWIRTRNTTTVTSGTSTRSRRASRMLC